MALSTSSVRLCPLSLPGIIHVRVVHDLVRCHGRGQTALVVSVAILALRVETAACLFDPQQVCTARSHHSARTLEICEIIKVSEYVA